MRCRCHYRTTGIVGLMALLAGALSAFSPSAFAQEAEGDALAPDAPEPGRERAAAEVLFEAGRVAMDAGDYDTACQKFEASMELDPAPGTLMNLGNCEEKRGRIASAWERYVAAQRELVETDRRYAFVQSKIAELDPKVPRLTIVLADGAPESTEVRRDAINLTGSLGVPLPLNPGDYAIEVAAEGYESRSFEVQLAVGETLELVVEPGERSPTQNPNPGSEGLQRLGPLTKRQWGYVVGGVGVAGVATALTAGGFAYQKKRTMDDHCDPQTRLCDATGIEARDTGGTLAMVANIAGAVGIAGVGAGLVLIVTSDDSRDSTGLAGRSLVATPRFNARIELLSESGSEWVRLKGEFW